MKPSAKGLWPVDFSKLLGVAVGYGLTRWIVILYFSPKGQASIFFLASGVALAAVLIGGRRYAWAVLAGALAADALRGSAAWITLGIASASTLAALTGAWLVRRKHGFDAQHVNLGELVRVLGLGGFGGSVVSAVIGSIALLLAGIVGSAGYFSSVLDWWMGDSLGVVLMTPLILAWWPGATQPRLRPSNRWLLEAAAILGLTLLAGGIVFLEWFHSSLPASLHLSLDAVGNGYWMFFFVAWAALRLGLRGTTLALLLVAALGITGVHQNLGFFAREAQPLQLTNYWFFSLALSLVSLTLAAQIEAGRRLTKTLRQSEASLSQELKNVMDALDRSALVSTVDMNRRFISVNDNYCDASGYSRAELLGQEVHLLKSGVHADSFYAEVYQTMAEGRVWRGEVCNRAMDGRLYWLQSTISPFFGLDGKAEMYVAIGSDITARKLAEQAQRESVEFIQKIAEQVPGCIYQFRRYPDGRTCMPYASEGLRELHGLSPHEVCESSEQLLQSIHVEDRGLVIRAVQLSAQQLSPLHFEYRVPDERGGVRWIAGHAMPQRNDDGAVLWHGSITDITQRKQSDIELQSHRLHLEELVQQKTADVQRNMVLAQRALNELEQQKFVLDQHAIVTVAEVDGSISYGNDRFVEISGYTHAEFMGRDHRLLKSGHHPQEFFTAMYATINAGGVWHAEVCNRAKDGHLYWVDTTIAAFMGSDGKPRQYIGVRTDITERKRAEEKSLAAVRAKSEFLANMSHEVRTPMNGVVGMIDILRESELLPEQQRMLDTIHRSSLSLLGILNDILDFSKIEAGKLEIEAIATSVREVVEGVAQLVVTPGSASDIDLAIFVAPELPRWMLLDPTRLRQILLNLLGNAMKFITARPGRVKLHVEPCTLAQGGPGVRFRVSDNGIGMSPQQLERLFQPFTQGDESTARRFGGTGLGLSITQRLVELSGGQIQARSAVGVGSEFTVELPRLACPPGRPLPPEPRLDGVRVLAVTQDAQALRDASAYGVAAGASITAVADLAAARLWLHQAGNASEATVVVLGLDVSETPAELDLPEGLGVVRIVRRSGSNLRSENEVMVSARPLLYHELIQGVALAAGRVPAPRVNEERRQILTRPQAPTVEQALARRQLILLAEDNETNRDVMREQLGLLGYAAEVASDGAVALQMWRSGHGERYGLLLTDCHMPHTDGFALTAAIRQTEGPGQRLPIVAVTANAMQGEAQRCVERGMDGYLSKPLRLKELRAMLAKWLPLGGDLASIGTAQSAPAEPGSIAWNSATLGRMVGDNPELQRRLLNKFVLNAARQVAAIGAAAAAGDIGTVADVAHGLKSAARTVGAPALGELCQRMETAGREGDAALCVALCRGLEPTFDLAAQAIKQGLT